MARPGRQRRTGGRAKRLLLVLLALAPVVGATTTAGIITNPAKIRPCLTEYSAGIVGGPLHMTVGSDGNIYSTEAIAGNILQFNPNTHAVRQFPVPRGNAPPSLHDIEPGPDGNIWFDDLSNRLGRLDIHTGQVTMFPGLSGQPHTIVWAGGYLYVAELGASKLARFDPSNDQITTTSAGLPPNNQLHSVIALPNGMIWATLTNTNELARYNPTLGRFDKLVAMPRPNMGPRDIVYVPSQGSLFFTLYAANEFGSYNLSTGRLGIYPTGAKPVPLALANNTSNHNNFKLTFIRLDAKQQNVWASTLGAEMFRLNVRTHKVTPVYCGITFPAVTAGIAVDHQGRMWVNEAVPGRIALIQP